MTSKAFPDPGTNLDIELPLVGDIKEVKDGVGFMQLKIKTKEKYYGAPLVLLPPFLTKIAMETSNIPPTSLFTEFMVAMAIFNRENISGDELT